MKNKTKSQLTWTAIAILFAIRLLTECAIAKSVDVLTGTVLRHELRPVSTILRVVLYFLDQRTAFELRLDRSHGPLDAARICHVEQQWPNALICIGWR